MAKATLERYGGDAEKFKEPSPAYNKAKGVWVVTFWPRHPVVGGDFTVFVYDKTRSVNVLAGY